MPSGLTGEDISWLLLIKIQQYKNIHNIKENKQRDQTKQNKTLILKCNPNLNGPKTLNYLIMMPLTLHQFYNVSI